MHDFASDNAAGVAPAILQAIAAANDGFALAYGDDAVTHRVERRFCEIFEREVAVFLVPTGTAANALALAHLTPPWGAVMCHREAHIISNECGAPEFFGGGLRLVGLDGEGGKIAPADARAGARPARGPQPPPDGAGDGLAHPGDRSRHGLPHRRGRRALRRSPMSAGLPSTWTAPASPMRSCASG